MAEPASLPPVPKAQRLRSQVAALLGLAVVLAALLIGGIAYHQGAFGSRSTLYFLADDVTGLAPGTTVRMSGFRIGKITDLQLLADQSVKVTLAIDSELFDRLRADARANVVREQLRPAAIDLRVGSAAAKLSRDDPRVAFTRRGTLSEIADDLRNRFAPILDDMRQLSGVARDRKADLDAILQNTRSISAALATTTTQLEGLATELRQRASGLGGQSEVALQQANRSLVRLDGLIGSADRSLGAINSKLPTMLEKTDLMLGQLDGLMRDSRTITAAAAAGLPPLLRSAPPLVDESREMLQGLRDSWPLRTMLPPPAPPLLTIDSHDAAATRGTR